MQRYGKLLIALAVITREYTMERLKLTRRQRLMAIVLISLGTSQVMAATVTLVLLLRTGVNTLSLTAVLITVLLTLASKLLFRKA